MTIVQFNVKHCIIFTFTLTHAIICWVAVFVAIAQLLFNLAVITIQTLPPLLTELSTLRNLTAVLQQMFAVAAPHSLPLEGKGHHRGAG